MLKFFIYTLLGMALALPGADLWAQENREPVSLDYCNVNFDDIQEDQDAKDCFALYQGVVNYLLVRNSSQIQAIVKYLAKPPHFKPPHFKPPHFFEFLAAKPPHF